MQPLLKKTSLLPAVSMGRGSLLFILLLFFGFGLGFGQSITIEDVSGAEDGGPITLTATLDVDATGPFSVEVSTNDGTATLADGDYTQISSQQLNFVGTAGETQTFDVIPTTDTTVEGNETLAITMDNLQGAVVVDITDEATVTITNDDFSEISIDSPVSIDEGDSGLSEIFFTITADQTSMGDDITFDYTITGGNEDGTGGSLIFSAGLTSLITLVRVTTDGDTLIESDEPISVTLSNPSSNAVIVAPVGNSSFTNDDQASISIDSPAPELEGDSGDGASTINFAVSIDQSDPDNPILVDYEISGGNEDTNVGTLTFPAGTATLSQTIAVTTTGDDDIEPDEAVSVTLTNASANGSIGTAVGNSSFTDDDQASISIDSPASELEGDSGDGASTINFTVNIDQSDPDNPITVDYEINGGNEDTNVGTLTFPAGTAALSQTIAVTTTGDDDIEPDESVSVTLSNASANATLATAVGSSSFTDDDTASIIITETDGNTITSEDGTTDTFEVELGAQPATDVVLNILSDDTGEGDASTSQITFTNGNWDTPQTITVTGIDDDIIDGPQPYDITVSVDVVASDDEFDGLSDVVVSAQNTDNDTAGITFTESDGSTSTSEDATIDTFEVVLDAEPATDVVVDIASDDTGEGTVAPASFTFTPGNWDTPQVVTVTGVDDVVIDGGQSYDVTITVNNGSSDDDFDGIVETVSVNNADNDAADFTIVETDGSTNTSEDGGTDTFTVVLDVQPTSDVVFDISSDDTGEGTVSPSTLTFTPTDWDTPQEITVTGENDFIIDDTQSYTITVSVVNADSDNAFNNLTQDVSVDNSDDDIAGFTIAESDGDTSVSETGTADTFTVVLNRGTVFSNVVIGIDSEDTGEATVSPSNLTFTPGNWNVPQTVTVTGVDDSIVDGTVNLDVVVSVDDFNSAISYWSVDDQIVAVDNTDDDSASVTITNADGNEDDGPITVSATLNNEVAGGFTVDVTSSDVTATTASSDYTFVNETLTFTGSAGEVQTFEVVPTADTLIEGDETLEVSMSNLGGTSFTVGISDTATITINNDDSCAAGTSTPSLNDTGTEFCVETFNNFTQNLNDYVDGTPPAGTNLVWSANPDSSVEADYLGSTVVTGAQVVNQDTYYGFYYDSLNDCASPNTVIVVLSVNEEPNPGTTTGASVCADSGNGGTTLDLDGQLTGADTGVWSVTADPSGGAITIGTNNVVDFDGQPLGNYVFTYTVAGAGICGDETVQLTVIVEDCSGPCNAGNSAPGSNVDLEFCDANGDGFINDDNPTGVDLSAYATLSAPAGTELTWSTSDDYTEADAFLNAPNVVEPGRYFGFFYDETNDCASPVMEITLVRNSVPTITDTTEDSRCGSGEITLTATASVDEGVVSYRWYDAPTAGNIVSTSATYSINNLTETTSFYVSATANGCESERVEVVATVLNALSPGIPIEDLTVCNISSDDGPTSFDLDDGLMGQDAGTWTVITDPSNGGLTIGTDNIVDFTGLASGAYVFEYTTDPVGNCTETTSAQLTITVQDCITNETIDLAITKTIDGSDTYLIGDEVEFIINVENVDGTTVTDIVISDILDDGFVFIDAQATIGEYDANTGNWTIALLEATDEEATLTVRVRTTVAGQISNTASLVSSVPVDDTSDNNSETVTVTVNRSQCEDPGTICNIFSPNGDGANDTLTLVNHELYPQNTLEIFDRYGNSVFQMDGYDSSWDGTGKNGDLPKGTYFYILDLNGDGTDVAKGWIQIVRDN